MFHVPTFLSDETNILQSTHRRFSTKINLIQNNLPQQAKKLPQQAQWHERADFLTSEHLTRASSTQPPAA